MKLFDGLSQGNAEPFEGFSQGFIVRIQFDTFPENLQGILLTVCGP
jgi:hypothetical protein